MEFKEILSFADDAVFLKTGKHLNDLQRDILWETLQGNKYAKIATKYECGIDHIRSVASELWKHLSDELGEKVRQSNVSATFERAGFTIGSSNFSTYTINSCGNKLHSPNIPTEETADIKTPYIDLNDAPSPHLFYGRTKELNTLYNWIIKQQSRLVAIIGLSGIGKTSLALQLIENIQDQFDYVIWHNLQYFPDSETLQQELINSFQKLENQDIGAKAQLRTLIKYLKKYRCLIILDNLQSLFVSGELSGQYQPEAQSYQSLFKTITDIPNQSCFLLISQEKPKEITQLEKERNLVYSLQLQGLDESAREIFKNKGLQDEDRWLNLINLYQGHPQWLKWIADLIQDLANGNVTEIFPDNYILLTQEIQDCLNQVFSRLSDIEKQIVVTLAKLDKSVTITELKKLVDLSQIELINGVRSLLRRCLIETTEQPEVVYYINPLLRLYCRNLSERSRS